MRTERDGVVTCPVLVIRLGALGSLGGEALGMSLVRKFALVIRDLPAAYGIVFAVALIVALCPWQRKCVVVVNIENEDACSPPLVEPFAVGHNHVLSDLSPGAFSQIAGNMT